ncbi:MAG TPA: FeoB-associated Cys-rich membrane protein [Candidatus Anaerotruncus excrementipullorum]|uniref:FeoB-associated Cys-rich membrane protein n=1 Tax=Candidatus Anaerotruncus excrementipullorum TaxID=2838465 RepID=A0A9D1WPS3_9FIRM|nr:FeoB-associated Cys-rich membrane protein [Candidatus Anaerotruncus excrementipullorum]
MGGLDYLVLGLLAVGVFFALRAVRRGAGGCSGGCAGCARAQGCRRRRED